MQNKIACLIALLAITYITGCNQKASLNKKALNTFPSPDRWKADINRFVEEDKKNPPAQNAVLFVGSSSIRMWDTKRFFPDVNLINRGFGGSFVSDSLYYADQIIIPYKPRVIVFYAGDNDIASGKPPEMISSDFKSLVKKIRKSLPNTKIIYISIKPSIQRWNLWDKMKVTNKEIKDYCKTQKNIYFVDVSKVMLDSDGTPRKDLFMQDGLHLNDKGYELWKSLIRPLLQ